jgi:hypothetical protein
MKQKSIHLFIAGFIIFISIQTASAQNGTIAGNSNGVSDSKPVTTTADAVRLSEKVRIDTAGNLGIGTAAPVNIFTIKLNGGTPAASWLAGGSLPAFLAFGENQATGFNLATAADASGFRPVLNTRRSRGTLATPTAVHNSDFLASFVVSGYDGSTFQNPATIDFYVDSTPSSGNVPGRISFVTGSNKDNRLERLKVGSTGNFNFNGNQLFLQQSTGSVGIGTSVPATRLHIKQAVSNRAIEWQHETTADNWSVGVGTTTLNCRFEFNGALRGQISSIDGSYISGSDRRLKEEIEPLPGLLDKIMQLKPSKYFFTDSRKVAKNKSLGFIAQDV